MPSAYRKQKKIWLRFKDATGRWRDMPTKLTTLTAARRLAQELEEKAERQRLGLEPMQTVMNVTFGEMMDIWWTHYGRFKRSQTIKQFADKHGLAFTLLSDPDKSAIEAYGVWGEKSLYGKKYMGILRNSYLIDPTGTIVKTYEKVKPADHALEIIKDLQALQAG